MEGIGLSRYKSLRLLSYKRIYFSPPDIREEDILSITNTLRGGWVATVGPQLDEFEALLKEKFHFRHVLALNSGTSALHLAIKLAGIERGDRVLVGTFTFVAVANAVLYEGGVPVFIDSDASSWNLDPELLQSYFTQHQVRNTLPKAVIVTHIFGFTADVQRIKSICKEFGVKLIEDAAEALGSTFEKQCAGSFGDYGVLSFNGNKIITAGGGGALICDSLAEYELAKKWATQSKEKATYYLHHEMGYNYRLTNVLAGLGISQLRRLDELVAGRTTIYFEYQRALRELNWVEFKPEASSQKANHWISPFLIKKERLSESLNPDNLLNAFEACNIEARRFWRPLHMQPLFKDAECVGGAVAQDLFERGICLPSGNTLSKEDIGRIIEVLKGA